MCVRTPGDAELSASLSGLLICRGEQSLAACVDSPRMGPAAPVAGSSGPRWRPDTSWAWPCWIGHRAAQRADAPRDLSVGHEGGQAGGQVGGGRSVAAGRVVDARRVSGEREQN